MRAENEKADERANAHQPGLDSTLDEKAETSGIVDTSTQSVKRPDRCMFVSVVDGEQFTIGRGEGRLSLVRQGNGGINLADGQWQRVAWDRMVYPAKAGAR